MFDDLLDVVPGARLEGLSDAALAAAARRISGERCRLDAQEAALVAEADRRRSLEPSVHRDGGAWLRHATGDLSAATAGQRVRVHRQLAQFRLFHSALEGGQIGWDHARALARHADGPCHDALLDAEWGLCAKAMAVGPDAFADHLAEVVRDLDDQRHTGETDHARQRRRRFLRRWTTRDGMHAGRWELDDESAAVLNGVIDDLIRDQQRAERDAPLEERRSYAQHGADALTEACRRSRAADVISRRKARPVILALADIEILRGALAAGRTCELADGTKLTARQIRRLACDADILPVLLDSDGIVLDMGRAVRLATDHQRLALRTMHPTCAVAGCTVAFDWCEIHRLQPWEPGGRTDLANLYPVCTYHHHLIHDAQWPIEVLPDRTLLLRDYHARPRIRRHPQRPPATRRSSPSVPGEAPPTPRRC